MKNLKTILFIAVLSLYTVSFFAQSDKPLNELSLEELEKEAKNNPEAQVLMGDYYMNIGYELFKKRFSQSNVNYYESYKKALKYYLKAAKESNAKGQYGVGEVIRLLDKNSFKYNTPYSLGSISDETLTWYQKAADQNLPDAQFKIGCIYAQGPYVGQKRDNQKAFEYYQKAANQNYPEAQYELALIYKFDDGNEIEYPDFQNRFCPKVLAMQIPTRGLREGWEPRLFRARGKAYPCGFNRFQYSRS